jgi:lipopolysaccharide transport system ATP-binding protein
MHPEMSPVLHVENLGKRYRVDHASSPGGPFGYRTLRDELTRLAAAPLRRLRGGPDGRSEDFWALSDVGFDVRPGEVVGVIGKNGAGKSTLLKILSRITKPTTGRVELRGRIGSLLEVGTGFHPELTGRENIYLNGAILGMSRREIARRFDEIVAFAEVEKFLDMPVKRYSSGMYVRLAFAVAAHLEPEILIVDEVLAVGDMAFQRKCMGRMQAVGRGGTTVLFVSHNMPAVESLCTRAILLDGGQVVGDGDVPDLIHEYRRRVLAPQAHDGRSPFDLSGPERPNPVLRSADLLDESGTPTNFLPLGGRFHLRIGLEAPEVIDLPTIGIGIDDTLGQRILTLHTPQSRVAIERLEGRRAVDCRVADFPLAPGEYWIKLALSTRGAPVDSVERALHFTIVNGEAFGEGNGFQRGLCVAPSAWALVTEDDEPI